MAKTYKTRPFWAQRTLRESHDHRHGECNLPPLPKTRGAFKAQEWQPGCYWWADPVATSWRRYPWERWSDFKRPRSRRWVKAREIDAGLLEWQSSDS